MLDLKLTIKNFRCFADSAPVQLSLKSGLTAFVGPNNAGKSSLLRLFYELRDVFVRLVNRSDLGPLSRGEASGFNFRGVPDPVAIFHDRNERKMTLRIECQAPESKNVAGGMELEFVRNAPTQFTGNVLLGQRLSRAHKDQRYDASRLL